MIGMGLFLFSIENLGEEILSTDTAHWIAYEKALLALQDALQQPKTSIVRDASIQRFEFCTELAWKTSKKIMRTVSSSPKSVVREMAQASLIDDPEQWLKYLDARNLSVHTYNEVLAEQVFATAKTFLKDGLDLLTRLKKA